MSSGFVIGISETVAVTPSTTSVTTLIASDTQKRQVKSVHLCNNTGTAADVTLSRYDGTTDTNYLFEYSVAANSYLTLEFEIDLPKDYSMRVTVGTSDAITAHARYETIIPNRDLALTGQPR